MYSEKYLKAFNFIIQHEGYITNDANDVGGYTIFGICERDYPEAIAKMKLMSREDALEEAKEFYYKLYWEQLGCEQYGGAVATTLFDSAINCGLPTVSIWIKDTLLPFKQSVFLFRRLRRYADLCQKNTKLSVYLLGWLIRVLHLWETKWED